MAQGNPNPGPGNVVGLIAKYAILAIIVAGIIGIVYVAAQAAGIMIPGWIITILWIVLAVIICAGAVKLIASMF